MTATTADAAEGAVRSDPDARHGLVAHSHGAGAPVPDQSRAERRASFDVADFPVPTGREEDWRFTPLDRVRELHAGAVATGEPADVHVEAPEPVRVETVGRDDERLGRAGVPEDRVAPTAASPVRSSSRSRGTRSSPSQCWSR
jgi:Fe-S cluster assembly protein SufD